MGENPRLDSLQDLRTRDKTQPTSTLTLTGSVSLTTDSSGAVVAQARYMPYGEVRWESSPSLTDYGFTGQRLDRFGLMDPSACSGQVFQARFYSARLGRFISADSIIPNPSSAMDFDRYMYAAGNPLRYIDPTGHLACNSAHVAEGDCSDLTPEQRLQELYGFNLINPDDWTVDQMNATLLAAALIGGKLAQFIEGSTPAQAFSAVYGGVNLVLDSSLKGSGWYAITSVDKIRLRPDKITDRLMGHEFGHVFSLRMHRSSGNKYTDDHPEIMLNAGLWDGDFFMTGGYGGAYRRNDLFVGPTSGYECDTLPCQYHLMKENTPPGTVDYMDIDSLSAGEEWADMFLNWGLGGFTNSPRGNLYNAWMTTNMSEWISIAKGR